MKKSGQLTVFLALLFIYAFCAYATYAFFAQDLSDSAGLPLPDMGVSNAVLGLANAGIVLVVYGLLGWAGYFFARKLGFPGIYRQAGGWDGWFLGPLLLGLACGLLLVAGDLLFAPINGIGRLAHPDFPVSILASLSAGIGEEVLFRGFVFGIWGLLLTWLFKKSNRRILLLWIANLLAALAFGTAHLGSLMFLAGAASLSDLSPMLLVEVFLLNGIIGLAAGDRYIKDGLVAAAGVHFWADVVFHVIWGLVTYPFGQ